MKHLLRRVLYFFLSKYFIYDITPIARCDVMQYKKVRLARYFYRAVIDVDESEVVDFLLLLLEVKIDK